MESSHQRWAPLLIAHSFDFMTILPRFPPLIPALSVVFFETERAAGKTARRTSTLLSASYRKTPRDTPLRVTSQFKAFLSCPWNRLAPECGFLRSKQEGLLKHKAPLSAIHRTMRVSGGNLPSQPNWETELTNS